MGDLAPTPRERAALDFAERLATAHTTMDDAFIAEMRQHFSDSELVELGLATGAYLMFGRLHRAFGVSPRGDVALQHGEVARDVQSDSPTSGLSS